MAAPAGGANLEDILRTLASLTSNQNTTQQPQPVAHTSSFSTWPEPASQQHAVSQDIGFYINSTSLDPRLNGRPLPQQYETPKPRAPIINPATIIEWKFAIRCVTKIGQQNPGFAQSIQKLIKNQEQSVKGWGLGRERLIEEQTKKRENEQTNRAVLSLPGMLDGVAPLRTPECDQEELDHYDRKVYRAYQAMVTHHSSELKQLGVPFFGVRPDLILPDGADPKPEMITKKELLALQRKMLKHLKDMYGE
ncbi:uncharacterized protein BDR25DRAFT_302372 [Lindgomyces ingoldianus]|uniref:Uncharacterized protein n=1 Tax=Lindgomyces ingoldianus TaxID=673940 RepID=A0ACB6R367_9PLEO|nr:uncharacterized protein BDR25DRAFT_302372 [Lindgomyces ingoldianus]KAF2473507.1 hypothetical protein BDR25DRAFT_302372 [Lindgomyces ingoldianus]